MLRLTVALLALASTAAFAPSPATRTRSRRAAWGDKQESKQEGKQVGGAWGNPGNSDDAETRNNVVRAPLAACRRTVPSTA